MKKFVALGCKVKVQAGSGARSNFSDAALQALGAETAPYAAVSNGMAKEALAVEKIDVLADRGYFSGDEDFPSLERREHRP